MAPHLCEQTSIVAWCTLFIKIVEKEVPAEAMAEDVDERPNHPWWKSKKWAYANLNRLFVRYVLGGESGGEGREADGRLDMATRRTSRPTPRSMPSLQRTLSSTLHRLFLRPICSRLMRGLPSASG